MSQKPRIRGHPRAQADRKRNSGRNRESQARKGCVDDDEAPSTSRGAGCWQNALCSEKNLDLNVAELVQFLLIKDQKKISIKQADVMKRVIGDCKDIYPALLKRASESLQYVFGYRLVELVPQKTYILSNNSEARGRGCPNARPPGPGLHRSSNDHFRAHLYEGQLHQRRKSGNFCSWLGVYPTKKHLIFGNLKKLITEKFVQQRYLVYRKISDTDYEFQWGPRGNLETSTVKVLKVCDQSP